MACGWLLNIKKEGEMRGYGKKGGGGSVRAILGSFRPRPFPSLIIILHSCTLTHQLAVNFVPSHLLAHLSMCVHLKMDTVFFFQKAEYL